MHSRGNSRLKWQTAAGARRAVSSSLVVPAGNPPDHGILADLLATAGVAGAHELATALLAEFGSLSRALSAGVPAQMRVIGNRPRAVRCLALVRQAMLHALAAEVSSAPILDNDDVVVRYLHIAMAHEPRSSCVCCSSIPAVVSYATRSYLRGRSRRPIVSQGKSCAGHWR